MRCDVIFELSLQVGQLLCMDPFFNGRVAGVVLGTSVALPHTSCNIHITEWFLVIGIVSCVTEVDTLMFAYEE